MNSSSINKGEKIDQLKKEGFTHVYEWKDVPNTEYPLHSHRGKVSFYIIEGDMKMNLDGVSIHGLVAGARMDVPEGVPHTAKIGPNGCLYVIGEEIEGDS